MTRDIAEYFIERGKRIRQGNDPEDALKHLHWAKRLWDQYDKMQQQVPTNEFRPVRETKEMKEIIKLIEEIEADLRNKSSDHENANSDDDTQASESWG
jgi:hypothetical protein